MKMSIFISLLLISLTAGCTLLEVESTKTETVHSAEDRDQSHYKSLEERIKKLEERMDRVENNRTVQIGGGRGGTQPVSE